jgi:uncharacterized protein (TIGR02452 family)
MSTSAKVAPVSSPVRKLYHSTSSQTLTALTFSRTWLAAVAKENSEIVENGHYVNSKGAEVDISKSLKESVKGSKHYHYSEELSPPSADRKKYETKMYVCYSLIIKAGLALNKAGSKHVGILNSADGFRPGGKFGTGCLSLEACICRGSLLWPCLNKFKDKNNNMYKINQKEFSDSPSSCAIFSPNVPIIRRDSLEAQFLESYEECSFVSLPPPNAFALSSPEEVRRKMKEHMSRALYVFAENGCTDLALCSFGCGTRGHDPYMVSEIYYELLNNELKGVFNRVVFAINPKKSEEYKAFAVKFEEYKNEFHK